MSDLIASACHALGLEPWNLEILGQGHFGSAWRTRAGTVVKVTMDQSEVMLVRLGSSHEARGLPVIFRYPIEFIPGHFAYEREDLENFPFESPLLEGLTVIVKPDRPMPKAERIARYDRILYGKDAFDAYPFVVEALRRFRRHGILVWDIKRSNLGLRGDDIVIRDGRCVKLAAHEL